MGKVKLKLNKSEMIALKTIIEWIIEFKSYDLDAVKLRCIVMAEFYEANIAKFAFIKEETSLTLKKSQALALYIGCCSLQLDKNMIYEMNVARSIMHKIGGKI